LTYSRANRKAHLQPRAAYVARNKNQQQQADDDDDDDVFQ